MTMGSCSADYLDLAQKHDINKLLSRRPGVHEHVLFSDLVVKINPRGRPQERVLLITDFAVYNVLPRDYSRCKRRIALEKVTGITVSETSDEWVLHISSEYDYRLLSLRKQQAIDILQSAFNASRPGEELIVTRVEDVELKSVCITRAQAKMRKSGRGDAVRFGNGGHRRQRPVLRRAGSVLESKEEEKSGRGQQNAFDIGRSKTREKPSLGLQSAVRIRGPSVALDAAPPPSPPPSPPPAPVSLPLDDPLTSFDERKSFVERDDNETTPQLKIIRRDIYTKQRVKAARTPSMSAKRRRSRGGSRTSDNPSRLRVTTWNLSTIRGDGAGSGQQVDAVVSMLLGLRPDVVNLVGLRSESVAMSISRGMGRKYCMYFHSSSTGCHLAIIYRSAALMEQPPPRFDHYDGDRRFDADPGLSLPLNGDEEFGSWSPEGGVLRNGYQFRLHPKATNGRPLTIFGVDLGGASDERACECMAQIVRAAAQRRLEDDWIVLGDVVSPSTPDGRNLALETLMSMDVRRPGECAPLIHHHCNLPPDSRTLWPSTSNIELLDRRALTTYGAH